MLAADDTKPFSADTSIKLLKTQRQIQQLQIQIADLQRQFDQATAAINQLRAQMDAYSNPQPFMPRYDELIRKYYRTISEQGRRKGD